MANTIVAEDCIACGACEPDCPNAAISQSGDTYVIDPGLCDECAATGGDPQCSSVCPADAIVAA
jgi:ferredoxin